jgi:hypothetical protein
VVRKPSRSLQSCHVCGVFLLLGRRWRCHPGVCQMNYCHRVLRPIAAAEDPMVPVVSGDLVVRTDTVRASVVTQMGDS